jgi:uncharacterized protein (DUF1330 family)
LTTPEEQKVRPGSVRPGPRARNLLGGKYDVLEICIAVGAGAVQLLHAASGAPQYVVSLINVKDQAGYEIKKHGGVYVGGGFNKTTPISGAAPPNRVVILKFDNLEAIKAWNEGGGMKVQKEIGETFAVEGVEQK